jgi:hypothetical protein
MLSILREMRPVYYIYEGMKVFELVIIERFCHNLVGIKQCDSSFFFTCYSRPWFSRRFSGFIPLFLMLQVPHISSNSQNRSSSMVLSLKVVIYFSVFQMPTTPLNIVISRDREFVTQIFEIRENSRIF